MIAPNDQCHLAPLAPGVYSTARVGRSRCHWSSDRSRRYSDQFGNAAELIVLLDTTLICVLEADCNIVVATLRLGTINPSEYYGRWLPLCETR